MTSQAEGSGGETSLTSLKRLYRVPSKRLGGEADRRRHRDALTLRPLNTSGGPAGPTGEEPLELWQEHRGDLYVPRFYGQKEFGPPDRDLQLDGETATTGLRFAGTLDPRRRQVEAADAIAKAFAAGHGGVLHLSCGMGKTCVALWAAAHRGRKTLVIVHKDFLVTQWRERIAQYLPEASVGRIQGPVWDVDGRDVVLGMMQSLSMRQYGSDAFDGFGLVIIDEAHRVCARTFSKCLRRCAARVCLALSATPDRKDGFDAVLDLCVGPRLFSAVRESEGVEVTRHIVDYSQLARGPLEITYKNGRVGISKMITWLALHRPRNRLVQRLIAEETAQGRRVLLLSERREHLELMLQWCHEQGLSAGMYRGGMKREALEASEQCQVVLGTYAMSAEGLDISGLNTLLLATPRTDIEQSVGRVQRDPDPSKPVRCLDIVDPYSVFAAQGFKRLRWMREKGFRIRTVDHRPCNPSNEGNPAEDPAPAVAHASSASEGDPLGDLWAEALAADSQAPANKRPRHTGTPACLIRD